MHSGPGMKSRLVDPESLMTPAMLVETARGDYDFITLSLFTDRMPLCTSTLALHLLHLQVLGKLTYCTVLLYSQLDSATNRDIYLLCI